MQMQTAECGVDLAFLALLRLHVVHASQLYYVH